MLNPIKQSEFTDALKKIHDLWYQFNGLKILTFGDLIIETKSSKKSVIEFINQFKSMLVSVNLIRLGGDGDGGYLVPDDFKNIKYCFSPGVSKMSNFEEDVANNYGVKSIMIDGNVEQPIKKNKLFDFEKKFLRSKNSKTSITLGSWVDQKVNEKEKNLILQMDIEGNEYEVFVETSIETFYKFRYLIVEFHGLTNLFNKYFLKIFSAILDKLDQGFAIAHVHPNNYSGMTIIDDVPIPRVIEVTFIRKDCIDKVKNNKTLVLPHVLDCKNVANRDDIFMPEIWWKK